MDFVSWRNLSASYDSDLKCGQHPKSEMYKTLFIIIFIFSTSVTMVLLMWESVF